MCSSEIRLLQQRSGLAGYRALPAPLSPLAGAGAGQATQGGSAEGPREKKRVGRHSTGRLLQDTPVPSLTVNVANRNTLVRHVPRCQNTEANTFRARVYQAGREKVEKSHCAHETFLRNIFQQNNFVQLIYYRLALMVLQSKQSHFMPPLFLKRVKKWLNTFQHGLIKVFSFFHPNPSFHSDEPSLLTD